MKKFEESLREWKERTHFTKCPKEEIGYDTLLEIQEHWADYTYYMLTSLEYMRLRAVDEKHWRIFRHAIVEAVQAGIATAMDEKNGTL